MMGRVICLCLMVIGLSACNDKGTSSGMPPDAGAPTPVSGPAPNSVPTISGVPAASINVDKAYSFRPSASDLNGDPLVFSVDRKPAWLNFDASSGALSGTPTVSQAGTYAGIVIHVSDGKSSATLGPFSVSVVVLRQTPVISGKPSTSVIAGRPFSFVPISSDPNGDALHFSIQNKPSWASFDPASGALSGTPTVANIGTTAGILISVSDGSASATLPAFSITVSQVGTSSATLSWTPPQQNTDGTPLTNLAGYKVYYGRSATALTSSEQISNPGIATYVIGNLNPGVWYFAIKSYTAANIESDFSGIVSGNIR